MPTTTDALDPELATAFAAMPKAANGTLLDLSDIPALRAQLRAAHAQLPASPPDPRITIETLLIPRDDKSELEVVLYRPAGAEHTLPALLWFHAGAQVLGDDAHVDDAYHTGLALALDCVLAAVVYRLAPETPAPGAAEDGYLAYTHLVRHADDHRITPSRIGLAGASGGGSPAAATALMARDRQSPPPCLLSLLYPMLDDRMTEPSTFDSTAEHLVSTRKDLQLAWTAVLGNRAGTQDVHPYCAPARATNFTDLPDTFIAVAQFDQLRDEGITFAHHLTTAGIPVDLHLYARAFHAWDRFAPTSTLTHSFEQTWHTFLRRRLHG
ncbi:alpha/beta hydrolase fold domain-containing protein [Umezawaea tangerina]|uniref:Acetyl esterase/lipase n=1 Tax=Umezawaea tangerina TaxID=84725 RepID=A0A2T0SRQ6_9PSEU|nr:alpha/beta hydrolase fold domain-containing protein [Umezawaea tangerina]PRY36102.1 acetyl esterase/lipase [Umezawaea tangerina]